METSHITNACRLTSSLPCRRNVFHVVQTLDLIVQIFTQLKSICKYSEFFRNETIRTILRLQALRSDSMAILVGVVSMQ